MEALVFQKKRLVLVLVKQTQNVASFCIAMIVCLLMEKKSISLKLVMKMLTFQINFLREAYLINLVLSTQEKFH